MKKKFTTIYKPISLSEIEAKFLKLYEGPGDDLFPSCSINEFLQAIKPKPAISYEAKGSN